VLLAASWTPMLADLAGRRRFAAALIALPVALTAPLVLTRVLPPLEPWLSAREVARTMALRSPVLAPLVLTEPPRPTLRLLAQRNIVVVPDAVRALDPAAGFAARDSFVYFALRDPRALAALQAASPRLEVLEHTPTLTLLRARPAAPDSAARPGSTAK
jgi:hypothetical protein